MSKIFKSIILNCVISGIFGITNVRDDVHWFKQGGDKLKDRFVTGVVHGIMDVNCEETANGATVQGECMSKLDCVKNKGKVGNICSLLGVCCVIEKTCAETTSSKLSYFVPPAKFTTDCPLTVNIMNNDVCQIRLDFEEFDLAKPTSNQMGENLQDATFTSYRCQTDSFKVEEVRKNLGFTSLCGKNKGQHIYVPVLDKQSQIILRFNLKSRASDQNLEEPKWRIRIQQLECQKGVIDGNGHHHHHLNAASKLMALYNNLKNKKHRPKSDYDLIAPPNCLQYYPEKNGQFESFNYDGGNGVYLGPTNYAICFRKTPDTCGIKYTVQGTFQMNYNPYRGPNEPVDDKCHPRFPASRVVSQDYIRIPEGVNSLREFKDNYCDTDLSPLVSTVTSKSREPIYVGVHTDEFLAHRDDQNLNDFQEIGFRLKYEIESGNCDMS